MFYKKLSVAITAFTICVLILLVFAENALGEVVKDGLVAEYHFEGNAYDSSGNGNNGGVYQAFYIDGKFGKALDFNGINSSIKVPDSMSLSPVSEITLEAWVKPKGKTAKWSSIISKMEKQQDLGYELYLLPKNKPRFGIISRVGGGKTRVESGTIPGDTWTHIVATYDGNALIIYIDGVFDSFIEKQLYILPSKGDLWIGSWKDADHFHGAIDEVRIYNRSLSTMEIKANYEAVVSPDPQTYISTSTPTPTLTPESVLVATPNSSSVYTRIKSSEFVDSNLKINNGDEVMWDNMDDATYTIVEIDKKIGNVTLRNLGRAKYIFNTSGNYRFCLFKKSVQQKAIQDINVVPSIITSISTPSASPVVTSPPITPTLTATQITTPTSTSSPTPTPAAPGFNLILTVIGIIIAFIRRQR